MLGEDAVPIPYPDYVYKRQWIYKIFKLSHVLMFPIISLMIGHGTFSLFPCSMFRYFLALAYERLSNNKL